MALKCAILRHKKAGTTVPAIISLLSKIFLHELLLLKLLHYFPNQPICILLITLLCQRLKYLLKYFLLFKC